MAPRLRSHSATNSNGHLGTTSRNQPGDNEQPDSAAIAIACEGLSKVQATIDLFNAIPGGTESTSAFTNAFKAYIDMLESHESRDQRSTALGRNAYPDGMWIGLRIAGLGYNLAKYPQT